MHTMLNIRVKKYKEDKPEVPDTFNLLQPELSFTRSGKLFNSKKILSKVANKRKALSSRNFQNVKLRLDFVEI